MLSTCAVLFIGVAPVLAQTFQRNTQDILKYLGTGANVKTPTPFGFGGWIAMTKGDGGMGALVLTQASQA